MSEAREGQKERKGPPALLPLASASSAVVFSADVRCEDVVDRRTNADEYPHCMYDDATADLTSTVQLYCLS